MTTVCARLKKMLQFKAAPPMFKYVALQQYFSHPGLVRYLLFPNLNDKTETHTAKCKRLLPLPRVNFPLTKHLII
jgi:hypothetical protein